MKTIEIKFYITHSGKNPINKWIDSLDNQTKRIIFNRLNRIRLGNFGDTKKIIGVTGLWELRIHDGPGYRIYFGKEKETIIILLTAGPKKSQTSDIKKVEEYWIDHKDRL